MNSIDPMETGLVRFTFALIFVAILVSGCSGASPGSIDSFPADSQSSDEIELANTEDQTISDDDSVTGETDGNDNDASADAATEPANNLTAQLPADSSGLAPDESSTESAIDVLVEPEFNSTRVTFDITVPAYVSNALQVRVRWGDIDRTTAWVIDESWSVSDDFPTDLENLLTVTFSDQYGAITLGSVEQNFRTGTNSSESFQITADQFDTNRWDSDADGVSNLDELTTGTNPFGEDESQEQPSSGQPALPGIIHPGNGVTLYNEIVSIINLEPYETFLNLGRELFTNPSGVSSQNYQLLRVESGDQQWICDNGICELPDFTATPVTRAHFDYQCSGGGTLTVDLVAYDTRNNYELNYTDCVLHSGHTVNGNSNIELTPIELPLGPRELHRFRNVVVVSPEGMSESFTGQVGWIGDFTTSSEDAGHLTFTAIPGTPQDYARETAEGLVSITSASIRRIVGRTFRSTYDRLSDWQSFLVARLTLRSPATAQQVITVSTPDELVTGSSRSCFSAGSLLFEADDGTSMLITATGVEDQVSIRFTNQNGEVIQDTLEPWITEARPVPPKQLNYLLDTAPVDEADSCGDFLIDPDRVAPIVLRD